MTEDLLFYSSFRAQWLLVDVFLPIAAALLVLVSLRSLLRQSPTYDSLAVQGFQDRLRWLLRPVVSAGTIALLLAGASPFVQQTSLEPAHPLLLAAASVLMLLLAFDLALFRFAGSRLGRYLRIANTSALLAMGVLLLVWATLGGGGA